MPIARHDSIRICIEKALVLIATILFQSAESGFDRIYQRPINSTEPDGSKDAIICGDGKDEIWINFSIDGDQVSDDCEIIHKG